MASTVLAPARITIVEDDRSLLGALAFALEADGYHVTTYNEARRILADPPSADCLVVDLKLPDLDGLTLISQLRERGVTTPAILITTRPDERCRTAAARAGVLIVEKPLLDSQLRWAIEAAVLKSRG
jgi:two-component system response regulator FixJ